MGVKINPQFSWLINESSNQLEQLAMELLSSGEQLIDFSMINPDMAPNRALVDRLVQASLKGNSHRYAVSRGIMRLRQAFAHRYKTHFGSQLDPQDQVCVTMGSKEAVELVLRYCIPERSRILAARPTYPGFISAAKITGHELEFFDLWGSEDAIQSEVCDKLERLKPALLLLNLPDNPSGRVVSAGFLQAIVSASARVNTIVLNDFTYGEMGFSLKDRRPVSLLSIPGGEKHCLEAYSLSKAFSVPGWRVGALLGPPELIRPIMRLKSHLDYGLFLPLQIAAEAALESDLAVVRSTVNEYERRHALMSGGLATIGFVINPAQAGVCVWAQLPSKLTSAGIDSSSFAYDLLLNHKVRVLPGKAFGVEFDSYIRLALVQPEQRIRLALERIELAVASI